MCISSCARGSGASPAGSIAVMSASLAGPGAADAQSATTRATSMLPRVAFEYGQTMCAWSTSSRSWSAAIPGAAIVSSTSMPNPLDLADADLAGDRGRRRQRDLGATSHELERAEEAGRVAGGKQLLGISCPPPAPPSSRGVDSLTSSTRSDEVARSCGLRLRWPWWCRGLFDRHGTSGKDTEGCSRYCAQLTGILRVVADIGTAAPRPAPRRRSNAVSQAHASVRASSCLRTRHVDRPHAVCPHLPVSSRAARQHDP